MNLYGFIDGDAYEKSIKDFLKKYNLLEILNPSLYILESYINSNEEKKKYD